MVSTIVNLARTATCLHSNCGLTPTASLWVKRCKRSHAVDAIGTNGGLSYDTYTNPSLRETDRAIRWGFEGSECGTFGPCFVADTFAEKWRSRKRISHVVPTARTKAHGDLVLYRWVGTSFGLYPMFDVQVCLLKLRSVRTSLCATIPCLRQVFRDAR
jgi:hypothetical protein